MWVANHLLSRWYTSTNQQTDGGNFAIPTQRASHRPKNVQRHQWKCALIVSWAKNSWPKRCFFFLSLDLYGLLWSWWWFQIFFIFTPNLGEMIQLDEHIFHMSWFNHHLVVHSMVHLKNIPPEFGGYFLHQAFRVHCCESRAGYVQDSVCLGRLGVHLRED